MMQEARYADEAAATAFSPDEDTVLVVDDAPVDRRVVERLLEDRGWRVVTADNGAAALQVLERERPCVVLTDLRMPEMDGLELVEAIRAQFPFLPVVLMTAHGSEELALQALRQGAASYVPKGRLEHDLAETLDQVASAGAASQQRHHVLRCLTAMDSDFVLNTDRALISALVPLLQENLVGMGLCDEIDRIRVGVALEESLVNALYHGNLECSSELRQRDDRVFYRLVEERKQQPPYRDRRIYVRTKLTREEAVYVIRDQGHGFDPSKLPDPTDPEVIERLSGRGLLLIRTFMDEVRFNDTGTQITLVKRCSTRAPRALRKHAKR